MSGFKEMVEADNANVFLNAEEFANLHTVIYDGARHENIDIVLTRVKEEDRKQHVSDHGQGLYLVSNVMHCAIQDLGGNMPEQGKTLKINDETFFRSFYVAASSCAMGMLRVELEAIDE